MSDLTFAPPACPSCGHARRVKVIEYTGHDKATGGWYRFDAWACDGCWIVVEEIPGTRRESVMK